jgi:hypothetical protein
LIEIMPHQKKDSYMRKLWNQILYGSAEGPEIIIDWEKRSVTIKRLSARKTARLISWIRYRP